MTNRSILKTDFRSNFKPGTSLPRISTNLDSVRSYPFEVQFHDLPLGAIAAAAAEIGLGLAGAAGLGQAVGNALGGLVDNQAGNVLTTAAKQVSPIGGAVDDIVVDRLNDKVYYPGKFTPENVTITFDNQLLSQATPALWGWFKTIYNPLTGDQQGLSAPGGSLNRSFKCNRMTVLELDNTNNPTSFIQMYGVYPTGVRFSEKNYSTNDFATVEVTFRYDFLNYGKGIAP